MGSGQADEQYERFLTMLQFFGRPPGKQLSRTREDCAVVDGRLQETELGAAQQALWHHPGNEEPGEI